MNAPDENALRTRCAQATALLREAAAHYGPAVHTNSFQAEGVVLAHLIATAGLPIETVSLDTGRLPEETYAVAEALRARYGLTVRWLYPDPEALAAFTAAHGPNAFYRSVELRRQCCALRKVQPLARALAGRRAWITGRRGGEGGARAGLPEREWDEARGIHKFNPLATWTRADVWAVIRRHDIPYHPLHDRHYPSIGCAPCTRAVAVGEDPRAGRWWWEHGEVRECGIHGPARRVPADAPAQPEPPVPDVGL
jgi:phosphoadenosine phosphosulfate reductase